MDDNHRISREVVTLADGSEKIVSTYRYGGKIYTREYIKVKKEQAKKRGPKLGSKHRTDPVKLLEKIESQKAELENMINKLKNQSLNITPVF